MVKIGKLLILRVILQLTTQNQLFTINHLNEVRSQVVAKDKEVKCECVYLGPHEDTRMQPVGQQPSPPSPEFAQSVALSVLSGARGKYRPGEHFRKRMGERDFDVFEMEYAIRNGKCVEGGEYSDEHRNHKYRFRGNIDGTDFDAVFALSAEHDMFSSPLLILITGCWKTKAGRRSRTY